MDSKFIPPDVLRYLQKYSLKGWQAESDQGSFKTVVVIPAIAEYENVRTLLNSLLKNTPQSLKHTLILFVVNNIKTASAEIKEDNLRTLTLLRTIVNKEHSLDQLINNLINSQMNIGYIDACSDGKELPERDGGVGFARKIGMDSALTLFEYSNPGKNILICLDADCRVDSNYLEKIIEEFNEKDLSAACIQFRHVIEGPAEQQLAIICYELFLRYYVLGLKYANSAYAFHTVGSSMACDHNAYIKAEGMNKLKAAEDFYFLEKLAKNYSVAEITDTTVYPSSRGSWRVPFGTGQRVNRYLSHQQNEYVLYNPDSFDILKSWLKLFNSSVIQSADKYLDQAGEIHPQLKSFLKQQNFQSSWDQIIRNNRNEVQIQRQKTFWFDGFRSLKLIHYLRDNGFPLINMFDALDIILNKSNIFPHFQRSGESIPALNSQLQYLELLRTLT